MKYEASSIDKDRSGRFFFALDDDRIWLFFALFVGIGLRSYFLAQPMRYDESFTFLNFVNRDLENLFFYPLPNNHVFHSILTKASTLIWGANPVSIRLTAFLAGVALIPAGYRLCRAFGQRGVFASIAIAITPYFVLYSTNARGYTLLVLFTLLLTLIGKKMAEQPSLLRTSLFSLTGALGMFTIPSMMFPLTGIYLWVVLLMLIKGSDKKSILYSFAIPGAMITGFLTVLFYIPVILVSGGIESLIANRFLKAQPLDVFTSQIVPHFIQTVIDFTRDIPDVLLFAVIILFVMGVMGAIKQRNWPVLLILPSLIITSAVLFLIKQKIPFERTWIFFIPFFILIADTGLTYLVSIVSGRMQLLLKSAAFSISVFMAISLISRNAILTYQDTGTFADAEIVARYLKPVMSANDTIQVQTPSDWPLYFYMWYHNVPQFKGAKHSGPQKRYVVVMKSSHATAEIAGKRYITLLDMENYSLIEVLDN